MTKLLLSILLLAGLLWATQSGWAWEAVEVVSDFLTRLIVDNLPE